MSERRERASEAPPGPTDLEKLVELVKRRPPWQAMNDATDRYRRWWWEVESALQKLEGK